MKFDKKNISLSEVKALEQRAAENELTREIKLKDHEDELTKFIRKVKTDIIAWGCYFITGSIVAILIASIVIGLGIDLMIFPETHTFDRDLIGVKKLEDLFIIIISKSQTIGLVFIGFLLGKNIPNIKN